jgi:hypothetical protein
MATLVEVNEVDDGRERPRDGYYADRNCVPWYARMSFGERAAVLWAADDDTGLSTQLVATLGRSLNLLPTNR